MLKSRYWGGERAAFHKEQTKLVLSAEYSLEELLDKIGAKKLDQYIKEGLIFKIGIGRYVYYG